MKFVALVSGGKDSFYSVLEAIRQGHELVACGHLAPRRPVRTSTVDSRADEKEEEEEESYMYQTAASETIPTLVEDCLGVPLFIRECQGRSKDTSLVYDHAATSGDSANEEDAAPADPDDEVEDLYLLLKSIKTAHPEITAVTSGAILSTYQRTRIESVCSRLALTPLSYLWRIGPQRSLLQCMLEDGIDAVLVKVASPPGLIPQRHLNKTLAELFYSGHFDRLKERFDFHICGEGGEYETLVLDAPIFKKRLVLDEVQIIDTDDGVGILRVNKCHAEAKDGGIDDLWRSKDPLHDRVREIDGESTYDEEIEGTKLTEPTLPPSDETGSCSMPPFVRIRHLPRVKVLRGGLAHVSEILSSLVSAPSPDEDTEANLAVEEALDVFSTLRATLSNLFGGSAASQDVVYVHLYLSNISHFAKINKHYSSFFGTILPPSRSCVSVGTGMLPGGRRVMLDCMVQRGSGRYMRPASVADDEFVKEARANPHHALRSTLHVQSMSHWAPVCVGPYSQANTIRGGITFLAGQIGLDPPTMTLIEGGWKAQLKQSWTNAASVLDALGGSLSDCLSGLVYMASGVVAEDDNAFDEAERLCRRALERNGGVIAGYVDDAAQTGEDKFGGYEDEGTWKELCKVDATEMTNDNDSNKTSLPLLMVALPQMPVGAIAEVELVCASSRASSCLGLAYSSNGIPSREDHQRDNGVDATTAYIGGLSWGHEFEDENDHVLALQQEERRYASVTTACSVGFVGNGCAAVACAAAYVDDATTLHSNNSKGGAIPIDTARALDDMLDSVIRNIEETAGIEKSYVLHVRLYSNGGADGTVLRSELAASVASKWGGHGKGMMPAVTVVPVSAVKMLPAAASGSVDVEVPVERSNPIMAMQVTAIDAIHMETEMWINYGRSYE